ncbi:alkaline phosphatase D family protein [Parvularcula oceani]|uniref:alkaline phosphatase D family protein n=1 Tax=Parvularcula oceani TaxID=1247963 RepID=UPI00068F911B|nr:alkaline phosphatase D family protein [Parvularcula oceani]
MTLTRRRLLAGGLFGLAACGSAGSALMKSERLAASGTFSSGVASGDPRTDSVVLWTRAAPAGAGGTVSGMAELSDSPDFDRIVWSARFETGPSRDYTVKLVADGLEPGRRYHYRFLSGDAVATGRTRTLPEQAERARFAIVSCSNYPFGYFNAYDHIARGDFDAVIHLGDYIYEYGRRGYGGDVGKTLGRQHEPAHEIVTLDDYRRRHRQYKSDPCSQAMHAAHPLIAIWDDHETANNSWEGGAQNHQRDEGDWNDRRRAALQAYYEYMPVRDPEPGRSREALYRDYSWGGLLSLAAIETRLTARSEQFEYSDIVPQLTSPEAIAAWRRDKLEDSGRTLMGEAQLDYLESVLRRSVERSEPWRLVANQVIMARVTAPNLVPHVTEADLLELEQQWDQVRAFVQFSALGLPLNVDAWDGYPAARQRFYERAQSAGARDLIVLTGDTHEFWANDLRDDDGSPMGVELGTTGVTSPGPTGYLRDKAFDYSLLLRRENPDVRWHGTGSYGYIDLQLDGDRGQADFVTVSDILSPEYEPGRQASIGLEKRGGTVAFRRPRGLGLKERVLF